MYRMFLQVHDCTWVLYECNSLQAPISTAVPCAVLFWHVSVPTWNLVYVGLFGHVNTPVPMGLGVHRANLTCLVCLFQWDLVCDSQWKLAMAQSMYMLGFLIGCIFFGNLSDVWVIAELINALLSYRSVLLLTGVEPTGKQNTKKKILGVGRSAVYT